MKEKTKPGTRKDPGRAQEINVTVHYADGGPSLESCMISILNAHLSESSDPCRVPPYLPQY